MLNNSIGSTGLSRRYGVVMVKETIIDTTKVSTFKIFLNIVFCLLTCSKLKMVLRLFDAILLGPKYYIRSQTTLVADSV